MTGNLASPPTPPIFDSGKPPWVTFAHVSHRVGWFSILESLPHLLSLSVGSRGVVQCVLVCARCRCILTPSGPPQQLCAQNAPHNFTICIRVTRSWHCGFARVRDTRSTSLILACRMSGASRHLDRYAREHAATVCTCRTDSAPHVFCPFASRVPPTKGSEFPYPRLRIILYRLLLVPALGHLLSFQYRIVRVQRVFTGCHPPVHPSAHVPSIPPSTAAMLIHTVRDFVVCCF